MSLVDELAEGGGRRNSGCVVCGATTRIKLDVRAVELDDRGQGRGRAGTTTSRSRSFCAEHANEMWEKLLEVFPL